MDYSEVVKREKLTRELQQLAGTGATPQNIAKKEAIKELVLTKYPGIEPEFVGVVGYELLKEFVDNLPEKVALAARWLLKLLETTYGRQARIEEALKALGKFHHLSWETWRRPVPSSPERNFFRPIAEALIQYEPEAA